MGAWTIKASKVPEEKRKSTFDPTKFENVRKTNIRYHYRIGKNIEEEGFAVVHEAEQFLSEKKRMIKFVPIKSLNGGKVHRLLREMSIFCSMDNQNIIKAYEVFQDNLNLSVVTEICNGGALFDRFVSQRFITENQVANCMLQMLTAIVYLHSKRIVHMDLKPKTSCSSPRRRTPI